MHHRTSREQTAIQARRARERSAKIEGFIGRLTTFILFVLVVLGTVGAMWLFGG